MTEALVILLCLPEQDLSSVYFNRFSFHFIVAEYLGEKLADFFGITTPKYQYVIDEYYRMKKEVVKLYFMLFLLFKWISYPF